MNFMIYWQGIQMFKKYFYVSRWMQISHDDASIAFLLGFGMAMHYPSKFERYVIEPNVFVG
jgi:hypothetical protein